MSHSCHESRLMKSNFHEKPFYKDFMIHNKILKNFGDGMAISAWFFVISWNMSLDSFKTFIELVFTSNTSRLVKIFIEFFNVKLHKI